MLRELHIANLAVIADANIELTEGLNVFTGQTGAGKSLVIGAFELLLGLRAVKSLLRHGEKEGRVSGLFEINDPAHAQTIAEVADLNSDDLTEILITRKFFASGRSSVSINGAPATTAMLKAVGELLVDVHGQHDHQALLKPANQLELLDRYAGLSKQRDKVTELWTQIRELEQQAEELEASENIRSQQLELYEFQAQEIDEAEPDVDEYEELSQRFRVLSNLERIKKDINIAHAALYENEGAVLEQTQMVIGLLGSLAELDEELEEVVEEMREAAERLRDASFSLSRYQGRLDLDPSELAEVEERLNILNRLISKYGSMRASLGGNLEEVITHRRQIETEMQQLRGESNALEEIEAQLNPLILELQKQAEKLSKSRKKATKKLAPLIIKELVDLGMSEAKIEASWDTLKSDDWREAGPSGFDQLDWLIQPNPGQPAQPLRKIASGGELSRVMLAMKGILAQSDRISVLVFDEVDANIGGRLGDVIGDRLRLLASSHQVLCITHLPQIAAYGDRHFHILKSTEEDQTTTTIQTLEGKDRVEELAEMLTGKRKSKTSRQQAEELLKIAGGK